MKLNDKDLQLVRSVLSKYFTPDVIASTGLGHREVDATFRRELASLDFEFFCNFYLSHHLYIDSPPFHTDLYNDAQEVISLPDEEYRTYAVPRGYAKSTIFNTFLPLWCALTKKRHYILMIADSQDQSKEHLATVKDELESNERILEDFGDVQGGKWQTEHIELKGTVCIEALGSRMKIRGRKFRQYRPDLIVCDDLQNLMGVQSETTRRQDHNWFFRSVLRAGARDCKYIVEGTIIHYDALLKNLQENPMFKSRKYSAIVRWAERGDLWEEWKEIITTLSDPDRREHADTFFEQYRKLMLQGTEVLWPARHSYHDLMLIYVLDPKGTSSFFAEMQNTPRSPEDMVFYELGDYHREWQDGEVLLVPEGRGSPVALSACSFFGFCDPSLGKTKRSDLSAIEIVAKAPTGQIFLAESDIKRRQASQIIHDIVEWARIYQFSAFGMESNNFQVLLGDDLRKATELAGIYLNVVPVVQRGNKDLRIQSLQNPLSNGYLLLEKGKVPVLRQQLEEYPDSAFDDGPDALEGVWRLARDWTGPLTEGTVVSDVYQFGQETKRQVVLNESDEYAEYERIEAYACPVCRGKGWDCTVCDGSGIRWRDTEEMWYPRMVMR